MTSPFVPVYKQFPTQDNHNLEKQLVNSYTQVANALNHKVYSIKGNSGGPVQNPEVNIVGTGGVSVSGDPATNTLTISISSSGFSWNVVTSADNPITLIPENGYITKGAGSVNFILPAAAAVGDTYIILGYGNLWSIAQNANQSINLGIVTSTIGVGGSMSANTIKDRVEITCVTANFEFYVTYVIGNPTIV